MIMRKTHQVDRGDKQRGAGDGRVEDLVSEELFLHGKAETLHDAPRQVLQRSRCEPLLQVLVAPVQPAAEGRLG